MVGYGSRWWWLKAAVELEAEIPACKLCDIIDAELLSSKMVYQVPSLNSCFAKLPATEQEEADPPTYILGSRIAGSLFYPHIQLIRGSHAYSWERLRTMYFELSGVPPIWSDVRSRWEMGARQNFLSTHLMNLFLLYMSDSGLLWYQYCVCQYLICSHPVPYEGFGLRYIPWTFGEKTYAG